MTPFPISSSTPTIAAAPNLAPAITTRQQLDALLENIATLQRERENLYRAQEAEIAAVRQRYRAPLAELDHLLDVETNWAEAWARQNSAVLGANRSLACEHARIGFRAEPPRIERASRRWTWSRIALTLAGLAWGRRYLRTPAPEVDKEALAADLARLSPVELRNAGMIVVQGERFFITPNETAETTAESPWQEAA
jgi:phage host-nuclease inhibitor protein Gam